MACSAPPIYMSTGSHLRDLLLVPGGRGVLRVGIAQKVPRRADEGIHGIGLARGRPVTDRAGGMEEFRHIAQRRLAGRLELDLIRQQHRKLIFRHRHGAMLGAVDRSESAFPSTAGD